MQEISDLKRGKYFLSILIASLFFVSSSSFSLALMAPSKAISFESYRETIE